MNREPGTRSCELISVSRVSLGIEPSNASDLMAQLHRRRPNQRPATTIDGDSGKDRDIHSATVKSVKTVNFYYADPSDSKGI